MKTNPYALTKAEGIEILLHLIEALVDPPEKKDEIKKRLQAAFEERNEVIAKYVLHEIGVYSRENPTEEQSDQISLISYNFV